MEFRSFRSQVLEAMKLCKKEFAKGAGALAVAEAKSMTPVLSGNLRRSEVYEVMPDNKGVYIGVTPNAPYAIAVEKGDSRHTAQPFLEPGVMNAVPKIIDLAGAIYRSRLGGDS